MIVYVELKLSCIDSHCTLLLGSSVKILCKILSVSPSRSKSHGVDGGGGARSSWRSRSIRAHAGGARQGLLWRNIPPTGRPPSPRRSKPDVRRLHPLLRGSSACEWHEIDHHEEHVEVSTCPAVSDLHDIMI